MSRIPPGAVSVIAFVTILAFGCTTSSSANPGVEIVAQSPTPPVPVRTPLPRTWIEGLRGPLYGRAVQLSCLDANDDLRLTPDDDARFAALDIELDPAKACEGPGAHADFYGAEPLDIDCETEQRPPALVVLVGGGGTDILQASEGESLGLLVIANEVRARVERDGAQFDAIVAASAIFGAVPPQGGMERYLAAELGHRLEATLCLRVAILGHSHGGVVVTAVMAALEGRYADRIYGILLDRSAALYDGDPSALPQSARVVNLYQLNEGWHGVPIEQPNVTNIDESRHYAPFAPSDGGGGQGRVSHKTLDDTADAQQQVEDAVGAWLTGP